jgi:nitroimidazol reductase NimA-like FMN-containing flavoprotein (pyridoxamine 5'-phosphate oxidase superfamily)
MPMTREEIDAFLAEPRLCHFATVDADGHARVRPLWFLWKDGEFWFTTRLETRFTGRDLASSPQVAVSIASEERPYRAVIAHGPIEVVGRDEHILLAIASRYGEPEGRTWLEGAVRQADRVAMRMRPEVLLSWDNSREGTDDTSKRTVLDT